MVQYFAISEDYNEWYERIIIKNKGKDITYQEFKKKVLDISQNFWKRNKTVTMDRIVSLLLHQNKEFERVYLPNIDMEAHVDYHGNTEIKTSPQVDFEEDRNDSGYSLYYVSKEEIKEIRKVNGYIPRR